MLRDLLSSNLLDSKVNIPGIREKEINEVENPR